MTPPLVKIFTYIENIGYNLNVNKPLTMLQQFTLDCNKRNNEFTRT